VIHKVFGFLVLETVKLDTLAPLEYLLDKHVEASSSEEEAAEEDEMSGEEEAGASDEDEIAFGTPGVLQDEVSSAA
jgi:hypothetical protein